MSNYNALLLDFDPTFASRLDAILSGGGIHLYHLSKPAAALALAQENPPDLVVLDLDRPPRQSIRFLGDLKKRNMHPKVLWVSSAITDSGVKRVLASGADGLLSREADTVTLFSAVQTILSGETYFPSIHNSAPSSGARAAEESRRILRLLEPFNRKSTNTG